MLENDWLCFAMATYTIFTVTLNRSLPVIIAVYRYIYVFHWKLVLSKWQKTRVNRILTILLLVLPISCTIGHSLYIGDTYRQNICMGREEHFYYNLNDTFEQNRRGAIFTR